MRADRCWRAAVVGVLALLTAPLFVGLASAGWVPFSAAMNSSTAERDEYRAPPTLVDANRTPPTPCSTQRITVAREIPRPARPGNSRQTCWIESMLSVPVLMITPPVVRCLEIGRSLRPAQVPDSAKPFHGLPYGDTTGSRLHGWLPGSRSGSSRRSSVGTTSSVRAAVNKAIWMPSRMPRSLDGAGMGVTDGPAKSRRQKPAYAAEFSGSKHPFCKS